MKPALQLYPKRTQYLIILLVIFLGLALLWWFYGSTLFRNDRTWEAMQRRGSWRVAMDPSFPPFETLDAQNQVVGYDVDLAQALADRWQLRLETVPTSFDSLVDALATGQVDSVISALPYDPRLTKDIAYSTPYFEAGLMLVVKQNSPIQSVDQLITATVAVELGSAGDVTARLWQRQAQIQNVKHFETPEEAIAALQNDTQIGALLIDNVSLRIAQGQGAQIRPIGDAIESSPYVIALPLGAFELKQNLEAQLLALRASDGFATIDKKWFGE